MKDFVGRYFELQELDRILHNERVCIVSGRPGIGKTYLTKQYLEIKEAEGLECLYLRYPYLNSNDIIDYPKEEISYLVVDDIDNINEFLSGELFFHLKKLATSKILIIRSNDNTNLNYPVIRVDSMSHAEIDEMINTWCLEIGYEMPVNDRIQIRLISEGHPLIIHLILELYKEYPLDGIINQLMYQDNRLIVSHFLREVKHLPALSNEEFDVLLILLIFKYIDINLFLHWYGNLSSETLIHSLVSKGFITISDNQVLVCSSIACEINDINLNYDRLKIVAQNMKTDILDGKQVDNRYPLSIIQCIRRVDDAVDFVATFYENQYKQNNNSIGEDIKLILKELGYVHLQVDRIGESTERTYEKIEKVLDIQNKIYENINQLFEIYQDNVEAVNSLKELLTLAQKPSNVNIERVSSIIGFLGSIASIASLFGAQVNLAQLQTLFTALV